MMSGLCSIAFSMRIGSGLWSSIVTQYFPQWFISVDFPAPYGPVITIMVRVYLESDSHFMDGGGAARF
jgi:hypothetical protein